MKRYYVVTNDDFEYSLYDSLYIDKIAEYTGKTVSCIKSLLCKHKSGAITKWSGPYKIIVEEEE